MSGHTGAVEGTAQTGWCSSEHSSGVGVASSHGQPGFIPPHTQAVLAERGLAQAEEMAEVTELLVSELTTNAYKTTVERDLHTPIALRLSSNRDRVLIEVWDGDATAPPVPSTAPPSADAANGRGLFLVHALAARWSWYALRGRPGKVIWAEVAP